MAKEKTNVTKGGVIDEPGIPDIPGVVSEDFSSFALGTRFVPDTYYPTPPGMYLRIKAGAGPEYPPDAHVTKTGTQHAIAVQLGALAPVEVVPNPPLQVGNHIVFDFPMALERAVKQTWITFNTRIDAGFIRVWYQYFEPEEELPEIPRNGQISVYPKKGETICKVGPLADGQTLVSMIMYVETQFPQYYPSEMPVEIKKISWLYADAV